MGMLLVFYGNQSADVDVLKDYLVLLLMVMALNIMQSVFLLVIIIFDIYILDVIDLEFEFIVILERTL